MKILRKFLLILTALCLVFSFGACGTYTPPVEGGGNGGGTVTPPEGGDPETPTDPTDDSFTVTLLWNKENFTEEMYPNLDLLQAQWTDKETNEKYRANFDEDGVASISGLDGDYQVTLVKAPDGYTYNPNIYTADNTFKNVLIDIYNLTPTKGTGADPYITCITIATPGAYRVTLEKPTTEIWFNVRPSERGLYSIESLVDVTANKINPILYTYMGEAIINYESEQIIDGGGAENTFTKNFRWEIELPQEEVGSVRFFVIKSTNDGGVYPLTLDFIYDKDGDFTGGTQPAVPVIPVEDFSKWGDGNAQDITPAGTFTYCANRPGISNHLLDEEMVRLNPEDGYYHYYDEVTGEYGDLLFVKITQRTEVVDLPFTDTSHMNIYYLNGRSYLSFIHDYYVKYVNNDGCYPVTEELKAFLMDYSTSQAIFNDGEGLAEISREDDKGNVVFEGYNSDEESQWMFACGYYA